ncbi:hypothetical protein EDD18DRAFT_1106590 [Armillaria luteobubalina]|uniref:Uncharacterized protein n=1 Tax=Armillaria luteobubalina TaxID=153913 RepID=A0AA39UMF6_9AGAR|nr:hypothetical protein EDD18DRAFT_1106590 [Armillaria luteobubalina]
MSMANKWNLTLSRIISRAAHIFAEAPLKEMPMYMGSKPDIPIFKGSRVNEDKAKAGFHHEVEDSLEKLRKARETSPECGFQQPPPPDDDIHEAFQRLLHNQIHEIAEDIKLDTVIFRGNPGIRQQEGRAPSSPSMRRPTKRSAPTEGKSTASMSLLSLCTISLLNDLLTVSFFSTMLSEPLACKFTTALLQVEGIDIEGASLKDMILRMGENCCADGCLD